MKPKPAPAARPTPTVATRMTTHPHTVRFDETVATARHLMTLHGVRHLPVLRAGTLVGIVSDRDLKFVPGDGTRTSLEDVAIDDPIAVDVTTPLVDVAAILSEKRVGSVLVTERGKLAGIFTTTDACRVLFELLHA